MYVLFGEKRVNLGTAKNYAPKNKETLSGNYYSVEFTFLNGTKEEVTFCKDKEKRDNFLEYLDNKNLLKDIP